MKNKTFLIIIVAVATILRVIQIGKAQLWYDEAFTTLLAGLPFERMITATAGDTHPPLYYIIEWLVVHAFGKSEWIVRLPPMLFSLGSIWIVWQIATALAFRPIVRNISIVLMTISPFQLHFSQENRMYSLLQLLVLLAVYGIVARKIIITTLANIGILYTHNYGLFYMLALFIAMAINDGWIITLVTHARMIKSVIYRAISKRVLINYSLAFGLPILLFIPWLIVLLDQMSYVSGGYWIQPVTLGSVIYVIYMLSWSFSIIEWIQPMGVLVAVGSLAWATIRTSQRHIPGRGIILVMSFVPAIMAIAVSYIWQPVLLFRGLIGSAPFIILMIAMTIERLSSRQQLYTAVLIVPVIVSGIGGHYIFNADNKGDVKSIIQDVRNAWQQGDVVYHINDGSAVGWGLYAPDMPQYKMPSCGQRTLGELTQTTRDAIGWRVKSIDELDYTRAFVVWANGPTSSVCEARIGNDLTKGAEEIYFKESQFVRDGVWLISLK
jgi:uncharacterized membrane protein